MSPSLCSTATVRHASYCCRVGAVRCAAGGKRDLGEDALAAAVRETREETGVDVSGLPCIDSFVREAMTTFALACW
jgi:8-oxo-dGTP pyrophosphatase MutT (NUDIX family)